MRADRLACQHNFSRNHAQIHGHHIWVRPLLIKAAQSRGLPPLHLLQIKRAIIRHFGLHHDATVAIVIRHLTRRNFKIIAKILELFLYNVGFVLVMTDFDAKNNPRNHATDQHVLPKRTRKLPSNPANCARAIQRG